MKQHGLVKKILWLAISAISAQAYASGYKMEFQSASILAGNGEAAAIEDAGTNWYNAAGNVYIPRQAVFSLIDVYAPTEFTGTSTAPSAYSPIIGASPFDYQATGTASSYPNTLIPAIHYVVPIMDRYAFGLSVVPAWGFKEDYGDSSMVRYNILSVYTKTIDISPSLSMKINDQWSIGLGPDFNYFSVQTDTRVRTEGPTTLPFPVPPGTPGDSTQKVTSNQWKTGWHAGILYRIDEQTRIGLSYRSKIVMHMDGTSEFVVNNGPTFDSDEFEFTVPLPATTTLSAYHDFTPRLALLATVSYDQWDTLQAYHAHNVTKPPPLIGEEQVEVNVDLDQKMKNAWNFSLGSHYKLNEQWKLRGSIKYEQTPTVDEYRQLAFPDGPKLGFQIGSRYQMSKKIALDLLYGHVFVNQVPVNDVNPLTAATSKGHSRTHVDLAGAQIVVNI